jgi:hypothetical protein
MATRVTMMTPLLIWAVSLPIGQAPPGRPVEAKKEAPAHHKVLYIGRGGRDIEPVEDRPALSLSLMAAGDILGDGKYVADDEMLRRWVVEHCTGHPRVDIVLAVREPATTTIRTMEQAIDRMQKHVPKTTAATYYVSDDS